MATGSRLLNLSPELRDEIYKLVFTTASTLDHDYKLPGILFACKQIYNEAIGLYYSTAVFITTDKGCLDDLDYQSWFCGLWLANLPLHYRELITEIRLRGPLGRVLNEASRPFVSPLLVDRNREAQLCALRSRLQYEMRLALQQIEWLQRFQRRHGVQLDESVVRVEGKDYTNDQVVWTSKPTELFHSTIWPKVQAEEERIEAANLESIKNAA